MLQDFRSQRDRLFMGRGRQNLLLPKDTTIKPNITTIKTIKLSEYLITRSHKIGDTCLLVHKYGDL